MERDQNSEKSTIPDWETGIPLWDALGEYTEPTLWNEYEIICAEVFPALPTNDLPPDPWQHVEIRSRPLPFDPLERYHRYQVLDAKVKAGIIGLLDQGKLLALGYRLPQRRRQAPTRISPGLWESGRVSWAESQLWTQTETFGAVRVIPSAELKAAGVLAKIPNSKSENKRGRPTWRSEIRIAYGLLREMEKINYDILDRNIPHIREVVCAVNKLPIDQKGLRDEAIRSAIRLEYRQDRERFKVSRKSSRNRSAKK